jgi:hypothetical protein
VALSGGQAYVAGADGLLIVDLADPASPSIVGRAWNLRDAQSVAVAGSVAYVADDQCGLQVIDVTVPAAPWGLGSGDTPDAAMGVAVAGEWVFVVDYTAGLVILPAQCEPPTSIADGAPSASRMDLSVGPNPTSSGALIRFAIPDAGRARVAVYDPAGRRIRELSPPRPGTGPQRLAWDGRDMGGRAVPAGWYLIAVRTDRATATMRLVVVR